MDLSITYICLVVGSIVTPRGSIEPPEIDPLSPTTTMGRLNAMQLGTASIGAIRTSWSTIGSGN